MPKSSEPFHPDVCAALLNRAGHYERAIKNKERAIANRNQALERGEEATSDKAKHDADADYGSATKAVLSANRSAKWAIEEILSILENASDDKLFADVVVNAKVPRNLGKRFKDEGKDQLSITGEDGEDEDDSDEG